jgi:hypothetical protein
MSVMCTKKEAARRRSRLYALVALALPQAELEGFMTSPKPPSEGDLIRYVKRTAKESLRCAHCGGSLLDVPAEIPTLAERLECKKIMRP